MPNFLVVGAAKSGTTSLYYYLVQHPEIYMPPLKEPEYFVADEGKVINENGLKGRRARLDRITRLADYQELFRDAQRAKARGEASAIYLYLPEAADRIKASLPDVQILVILRNPVERAHSAFLHQVRDGLEDKDFATALREEPGRIAAGWSPLYHYRTMGYYTEQLTRYYRAFGPDKVHVYLYDDLRENPSGFVQRIFNVLDVDASFVVDAGTQHNISGVPKNKLVHRMYAFLRGANQSTLKSLGKKVLPPSVRDLVKSRAMQKIQESNLVKPSLHPDVQRDLVSGYQDDVTKLQRLLGRDLTHWLKA
ncbi:MAG: hypothetical protein AVDCRST_MAG86-3076 [uncultured Truepera sp.]|uniref:Sulfotransferase n=1 Tax=uncultured Truepera sp. TaxID=543023 RepID=A0A6J4VRE0_9DEIN|nr:MAG: hypothetical protein AVDCRST_MAG86-3076 [uncultured Truepera sp.]